MKIYYKDFPKKVKPFRDNEIYTVHDLEDYLDNMNVSMTVLHPKKATLGHAHDKREEFMIFLEGSGEMQMDEEKFPVKKGDIVLVKAKKFHRVSNHENQDMIFMCIFEKYGKRGKNDPSTVAVYEKGVKT
jgi:mannose-6-phosphate isomerase-like protein (cupin superfamily)